MRIQHMLAFCVGATLALIYPATANAKDPNQLTAKEKKQGFKLLFNGSDLDGWSHKGNWKIENGVLAREGKGGSLVYTAQKVPDDFELRFEWKVAAGSNSGVYYRPGQYEYQILDNAKHADGQNPRTSAASLYFCMPPSRDNTRPIGQWNTARIVCKGTIVQHWLNGERVVGFDYADPKYAWEVNLLKRRGGNMDARGANLSLQDHGDPVWYRNIKLRKLAKKDKIDETPAIPAVISPEVLAKEKDKIEMIEARRSRQKAAAQEKAKSKAKTK
ncbi:MAG: 3-keto-disaccharide hydrolase [Planctomycetota bacterium]|jgi:hypothetical protein